LQPDNSQNKNLLIGTPWTLGWGTGVYEGGTATVTWSTSTASGSFVFYIRGQNDSQADLRGETGTTGEYWFWNNLISFESGFGHQFDSSGLPYFGTPDGIGLGQLENNAYRKDAGYWNGVFNLGESVQLLNAGQSNAYSFWTTQVTQATSANPAPVQTIGACSFSGSPSASQHSWQDAEWITSYNGTGGTTVYPAGYYIVWTGTNATNGAWLIHTKTVNGVARSYVGDVCSAPQF
jgi:hypothetical protein